MANIKPTSVRAEPQGTSLHGCSLLFDNLGQCFSNEGDFLYMGDGADTDSTLPLYRVLHDTVAPRENNNPLNLYMLPPKPAAYYHVTVWGGINDQNVAGVVESHRFLLQDWLARLPASLQEHHLHTSTIRKTPLVQRIDWNIQFRFERIVNWHNTCLAALLKPCNAGDERILSEIIRERAALSGEFDAIFGIKPPDTFVPHITLRRFVNGEAAQQIAPSITALSEAVHQRAGDMTLTFNSISLYGFTHVTRVFKCKM